MTPVAKSSFILVPNSNFISDKRRISKTKLRKMRQNVRQLSYFNSKEIPASNNSPKNTTQCTPRISDDSGNLSPKNSPSHPIIIQEKQADTCKDALKVKASKSLNRSLTFGSGGKIRFTTLPVYIFHTSFFLLLRFNHICEP